MKTRPRPDRTWLIAILLASFAVFLPGVANRYAQDAAEIAAPMSLEGLPNGYTSRLERPRTYLLSSYWAARGYSANALYRPLTVASFAAINALTLDAGSPASPEGLDDAGRRRLGVVAANARSAALQHLADILLHLACAALVYRLLRGLRVTGFPALLGTAVFALHANQTEAVVSIVGRAELLGFALGAAGTLLVVTDPGGGRRTVPLRVAGGLAWLLAFLCKETHLAWPCFAVLYRVGADLTRDPRRGWGELLLPPALRTAVVALPGIVTYLALRGAMASRLYALEPVTYLANPLVGEAAGTRILTAVRVWGYGLWRMLWPVPSVSDYGPQRFEKVASFLDPGFLLALVAIGGLCLLALMGFRRRPLIAIGILAFFGFGFITSNVPLAIGTIFGERLYYAPTLGLALVVAAVAPTVAGRHRRARGGAIVALALLAVMHVVLIELRIPDWRDSETLIRADAATNPRSLLLAESVARLHDRDAMELWDRRAGLEAEARELLRQGASPPPPGNRGELERLRAEADDVERRALAEEDAAIVGFRGVIERDGRMQSALGDLAAILLRRGFRRAAEGARLDRPEMLGEARVLIEEARDHLDRGLAITDEHRQLAPALLYRNKIALLRHEGRDAEALELLVDGIHRFPEDFGDRIAELLELGRGRLPGDELEALARSARLEFAFHNGMRAATARRHAFAVGWLEPVVSDLPPAERGWAGLALGEALDALGRGAEARQAFLAVADDAELDARFRQRAAGRL